MDIIARVFRHVVKVAHRWSCLHANSENKVTDYQDRYHLDVCRDCGKEIYSDL